ncbi:MAG: RluA family pseudouridine synthase [Balneola sp.]
MEKILNNVLFSKKNTHSRKIRLITPYPITHRFKPDTEFIGKSLLEMMCTKFPFRSEEEWKGRIESGRVFVNEENVEPDFKLSPTVEVFHYNPRVVEPAVPDEVEVLEEHENYLIVYKPAPMPMHPGGRYFKNTLMEILKEMGYEDLRITHRLDAVTSGIVLIARNKEFAKKVMHCFRDGNVQKTYLAMVDGIPKEKSITINVPIKRKHGFVFESDEKLEGAREAITHFEVMKEFESSALVKCIPETGRTHQIRLHLAKWGYPIIDDPIYGKDGDQSSKTMQKRAISLINIKLAIESLGVEYSLEVNFEF